jgi:hypothetical protein
VIVSLHKMKTRTGYWPRHSTAVQTSTQHIHHILYLLVCFFVYMR